MKLNNCNLPPTVYALLNSYVNFSRETPVKIADLAKTGRACFFDFTYPLATGWDKEEFETMILNHFLMRRIGYETVTAFKIALNVKLNEIMPNYNMLYSSINDWNIFNDGESITRQQTSNGSNAVNSSSNATNSDTSDRRYSNTPQNQLADVRDGKYVSEYHYDQNSGSATNQTATAGTDSNEINETITRSPSDKIKIYQEFLAARQNLYTMIFKDLDSLFYQVVS
ncbi:MAG: hypothetical protein IJ093_00585 [Bacilli bacterium]|nr:hypothetical protein [Bacilli bacterium]